MNAILAAFLAYLAILAIFIALIPRMGWVEHTDDETKQ